MSLEELLQKHFGLKGNLYLKKPKVIGYYACGYGYKEGADYQYETDKGAKAYNKLVSFLYDLGKIIPNEMKYNANYIVDQLDGIINEVV